MLDRGLFTLQTLPGKDCQEPPKDLPPFFEACFGCSPFPSWTNPKKKERSGSTSHPPGEFDRIFHVFFTTKPWSFWPTELVRNSCAPWLPASPEVFVDCPPAIDVVRAEVERLRMRPAILQVWFTTWSTYVLDGDKFSVHNSHGMQSDSWFFLCCIQLSCGPAFMKPGSWTRSGCFFFLFVAIVVIGIHRVDFSSFRSFKF